MGSLVLQGSNLFLSTSCRCLRSLVAYKNNQSLQPVNKGPPGGGCDSWETFWQRAPLDKLWFAAVLVRVVDGVLVYFNCCTK